MIDKDAKNIIRQRTNPSVFDYCFITTKAHKKAILIYKQLLKKKNEPIKLLDIGCGYKPFEKILNEANLEQYIGVDFDDQRSSPDIKASTDNLPLPNDSFDAIVATEVLEHTSKLKKTINEMRRVSKKDALIYISAPFIHGEHGVPYDFQRITSYRYKEFFKDDEILYLKGTNFSLSTPFFVSNLVIENISILKLIPLLPQLLFFLNNLFALTSETILSLVISLSKVLFKNKKSKINTIFASYFETMPAAYDIIVKIKK